MKHGETDCHDVLLAENRIGFASDRASQGAKPIREAHELGRGIWLGPIEHDLMKAVVDACQPRGENFHPAVHDHAHYGFYRHSAYDENENLYRFDPDGELHRAARLSRLIHPTSIGQQYAARIVSTPGVQERMIIPARATGMGAQAFVIDPESDWLTDEHARQLVSLVAAHDHASTPLRLKLALFYFEYAAWTYYVDLRWALLTTAAEALVHIEGERDPGKPARYAGSTQQFVDRMMGLQRLVPGIAFSEDDLRGMYRARSGVVHGQDYAHQDPEIRRLYALFEDSMRAVLRFLIVNRSAAELFASDDAVRAAFPLRTR